ncbi:MAG: hypothetical protein WCI90_00675 [Chlorobium sp.]|nr:MAG: hypothetical protein FDX17_04290 [Chlorobium sp.]
MGLSNEMKNLSEEILDSFKGRVKDNADLVASVGNKLHQFRSEQQQTAKKIQANAAELKDDLAVAEKDRLKKYNQLIGSIQSDIKSIEKDVKSSKSSTKGLMQDFSKARKIMSSDLDKFFSEENKSRAENEQSRMSDYQLYIEKLSEEVSSIFNYTNEMLEKFASEHKEMSAELSEELSKNKKERFEHTHALIKSIQSRLAEISSENVDAARKLKNNLNHGETERLKEYNALFDRISSEITEMSKSTATLLDNFSKDRSKGAEHWKEMQDKIAAIRSNKQEASPKKAEKVVEKDEIKAAVVVKKELPVIEEKPQLLPVEKPKVSEESTLEDKILIYINNHPQGVKVSDMEEPLHETRMKIGFAAKCLLDAAKVSKVENLYYPITKSYH